MKYFFVEEAEEELFNTVEYYEEIQPGLGLKFAEEIYAAVERIRQAPEAWTKLDIKTRRCLLNKFPFALLYRCVNKHIQIMAVMNLNRKPGYWSDRK
ncbi:MAG: type II toxin-antitoxin system RelE/ParE family toxin [Candidatus Marinimicrobia bacterium]|nr:type II toxin-antitoxin system RelE/ParE family toxin [Candidatus Neomarinimicrobiota bacterium]